MVVKEQVTINNKEFIHTYSDAGFYIKKIGTNEEYSDAYDVLNFEYEETERKIETEKEKARNFSASALTL